MCAETESHQPVLVPVLFSVAGAETGNDVQQPAMHTDTQTNTHFTYYFTSI